MIKNIFNGLAVTSLVMASLMIANVSLAEDSTVVISGNTSAAENQPGWMFNRDTSTDTPFEFNTDEMSIGTGALYVLPIGANASDKFIAENFINTAISEIDSISYEYKIGAGGEESDMNQFYMNVYANFGQSDDTKFYDCRYNVVAKEGSTSDWSTVTFDPTMEYPVTVSGSSPFACPASPADMDLSSPNSTIRVFAINVGDTSTSDQGLDGYLDNVVVDLGENSTTYDFEPADEPFVRSAQIVSPTAGQVVSDGSLELSAVLVDEDGDDSVQWAVRSGTCAVSTGTEAGNVDGKSDAFAWDGATFSSTLDVSNWTDGEYCFVFNPSESTGDTEIRETVQFSILNDGTEPTTPTTKDDCKNGGWMTYTNPTFKNQGQCVNSVATSQKANR